MSEGDKMLDTVINMTDIHKELEQNMDYIAKLLKNNLQGVINNAIDVQLYISLPDKKPVGFDIGIVVGGPSIRLTYSRGTCKLQGSWGSVDVEKYVDNEICETILDDYLTD